MGLGFELTRSKLLPARIPTTGDALTVVASTRGARRCCSREDSVGLGFEPRRPKATCFQGRRNSPLCHPTRTRKRVMAGKNGSGWHLRTFCHHTSLSHDRSSNRLTMLIQPQLNMATNTFQTQNAPTEDRHNGIVLVTEPSRERLNERQRIEYRNHRRAFIEWLSLRGKSPDTIEGYAHHFVRCRAYDTDAFYRWMWSGEGGRVHTAINTDQADAYIRELARGDTSRHHKENVVKSLKSLYEWHSHTDEWNPSFSFGATGSHAPRDYLTREERTAIREAALVYDSIPSYAAMSPDERNK